MSQIPNPLFAAPAYRPMTFSQILSRTFELLRSHFRLFIGIGAAPAAVSILFVAAMEAAFMSPVFRSFPKPPDPAAMARAFNPALFVPMMLVCTAVGLCIFAFQLAATTHAATQANQGISVSIGEAWRAAFNRAGSYLWLLILLYAITFLPAVVIELSTFGGAALLTIGNPNPGVAAFFVIMMGILLFFAALVFGILMALRFSLAFPACVVEGITARAALKRGSQLTKGAKGRIFVVLLVIYLACYAFTMVLMVLLAALASIFAFVGAAMNIPLASPLGYSAIAVVGVFALIGFMLYVALSWAALITALAVIYHDQRLHHDAPPAPPPAAAFAYSPIDQPLS